MLFKVITISLVVLLYGCDNKQDAFKAGRKVIYYDDGLKISQIIDFNKYAQQNGYYISFDTAGSIQRIQLYFEGLPHGERLTFYNNGNLKSKTVFKNGNKEGVEYNFYENGILESEIIWERDSFTGRMREYDEEGVQNFIHCINVEMYHYSEAIKFNKLHQTDTIHPMDRKLKKE